MSRSISGLLAAAKSGDWLDRERLLGYGVILLVFELLVFLFLVAGVNGWVVPLRTPLSTDFVSFYAAGHVADLGDAANAYFQPAHYAAEQQAIAPGIAYVYFYYPPVFILLCALLARLPYLAAFLVFEGTSLAAWVAVLARILINGERADPMATPSRLRALVIPLLAFPATFINFGVGQNGFLTAALFGGASLLIDDAPVLAGALFGALCYKPQFGLLIPVALLAGRRWRGFAAAGFTGAALIGLTLLLYGWHTWRDFLLAITASHATYESGKVDFAAFVSTFGALRLVGASRAIAYGGQAAASLAAVVLVAWVWWKNLSLPIRAATLAAATLVAVPLTLFYDLMLGGLAMVWLVRDARRQGFMAWEKSSMLAIYVSPLAIRSVGRAFHLPLGVLVTWSLLGLCIAHASREVKGESLHFVNKKKQKNFVNLINCEISQDRQGTN